MTAGPCKYALVPFTYETPVKGAVSYSIFGVWLALAELLGVAELVASEEQPAVIKAVAKTIDAAAMFFLVAIV